IKNRIPLPAVKKNKKKVCLIGGGPASLTVARDLAPLGYEIHLYDEWHKGGGMMRTQIPGFQLPERVLDEEVGYIIGMDIHTHFKHYVMIRKEVEKRDKAARLDGTRSPRGSDLKLPWREEASDSFHIGVEYPARVAIGLKTSIGKRVIILGG